MPIDQVFMFDSDEGIALIQANIYDQNIINNSPQIWSDQPPLFPIIISKSLDFFGDQISNARILILLFSTLLIWSFSHILRLSVGKLTAIITIILLIISINFLRLSVSVMQCIPCLSLGMLSIYLLILYTKNVQIYWIILSGIIFALSLQIKMIMIFLIPVMIIYFLTTSYKISLNNITNINIVNILKSPISIWLLSISTAFIIVSFITQSLNIEKILFFHISSNLKYSFSKHNSFQDVIYIYLQNFDALLLSLLGLKYQNLKINLPLDNKIIDNKPEQHIYKIPLFWLIIITFVFLNHKPIWYHYIILVSVPLTWLGAYGIRGILVKFSQNNHTNKIFNLKQIQISKFAVFTIFLTLLVIPIKLGVIQWENYNFVQKSQLKFANLERIITYKNQSKWLFTDVGMYGFYSQINIPPELTVISMKRLNSGTINSEFLFKVLEKYQPEQILINRFFSIFDLIKPYVDKNYQEIYVDESTKHYLRNNIQKLNQNK
ncbi:glycosyltransferase family 39 protein [Anabaena cylindrica FACHB-243]|nr:MULTISPECIES: glycosyltransferase family 39 protein [Anabaena]MBD2417087.1 glycosyltransferase family 39 protein [Anabaena cylindrica FACHB-243]MBY5280783.1 glycosyltransferase family 39 protein [Anabaena sp. CCAP 1446/1C]MBY5307059.1 glycosyltransferase family 39 protein [Anabaena sp. CCAP 1446/1C]MCM2406787.1 glycosyltransferase family 39 protein [Anabaena sp. CCAP 1446/1C]